MSYIIMLILRKIILITGFEFTSRASLWSTTSVSKFISAVKLGSMAGMERRWFNDIWSGIQWNDQPNERPEDMSHAEYR